MSELTKDDLLEFMKKHGPERVDSITDKDSAIKHFRTSSKLYKQQRDQFQAERDTCLEDIQKLRKEKQQLEKGIANLFNTNVERLNLLIEISQHIGSNPSSSTYKQFRKQLDDIGIRESADDER